MIRFRQKKTVAGIAAAVLRSCNLINCKLLHLFTQKEKKTNLNFFKKLIDAVLIAKAERSIKFQATTPLLNIFIVIPRNEPIRFSSTTKSIVYTESRLKLSGTSYLPRSWFCFLS